MSSLLLNQLLDKKAVFESNLWGYHSLCTAYGDVFRISMKKLHFVSVSREVSKNFEPFESRVFNTISASQEKVFLPRSLTFFWNPIYCQHYVEIALDLLQPICSVVKRWSKKIRYNMFDHVNCFCQNSLIVNRIQIVSVRAVSLITVLPAIFE